MAIQPDPGPLGALDPAKLPPQSEDCLVVNVTAPAGATGRPVLVWIHGGGYQTGSGTDLAADGAAFARSHGLVVVTFNYRLGALGFLDVPGEESAGASGLHDQIAVLRWVRRNIAGFGGDPGQVTAYGLSAGGKSVVNLLGSPLAWGLIQRAASSSGGEHVATPEQGAALAQRFFRELGTAPDRIRQVPAEEILAAQQAIASGTRATWVWRPTIDGVALTSHPVQAIKSGAAAGIPLLAQTCGRECVVYQLDAPDAAEQADRVLAGYFGGKVRDRILAGYAAARPELADDAGALRVAVMSDERYGIPTTRLADAQSKHAPVWRSRYDGPYTGLPDPLPEEFQAMAAQAEAGHGSDGSGIWLGGDGLAGLMHQAWGALATAGSPAAGSAAAAASRDAATGHAATGDGASGDGAEAGTAGALTGWARYDAGRR
jgi:para-nitrobenzyl esterase